MVLVGYSDSESSENEGENEAQTHKEESKATSLSTTSFRVNKTNPRKIQVKLQDSISTPNDDDIGEPAPKRPRVGAGAFSGFNSLLPPPKRDADAKVAPKAAHRKVFSLKTGAEPGFSRESDAELRQLFAEEQESNGGYMEATASVERTTPPPQKTEPPVRGNTFMFKPLSVARGKKKKPAYTQAKIIHNGGPEKPASNSTSSAPLEPTAAPKKISLFTLNNNSDLKDDIAPPETYDDDAEDDVADLEPDEFSGQPADAAATTDSQSLYSIASDLNLSEADRRQLFGRKGQGSRSAVNVVNFNIDQEYAANEVLRASGEQVQHNPVRAIAPGKHSLKQLVSAATGQKDALEESFATGRKNKKEAGSKYGW